MWGRSVALLLARTLPVRRSEVLFTEEGPRHPDRRTDSMQPGGR